MPAIPQRRRSAKPSRARYRIIVEPCREIVGQVGEPHSVQPLLLKSDAPIAPLEYLHYALNLPTSVVITGVENQRDLDQAFEATRTFQPMNKEQVAELLSRSRPYALHGKYELFKTSALFDGTAKTAEWLGDDAETVKSLAPVME
jgi:hypothetical protein